MCRLPKRTRARNLNPLPLFKWAEQNQQSVFDPLLITSKLASRLSISPSALNAMAEANGFVGRVTSNGSYSGLQKTGSRSS